MVRSPTNSGRKRDAFRTKAAILNAAISEFSLRGPAGTRVDEIAGRAGVNKSLIYQYFGSKQELYAEALNAVLSAVTEKAAEHSAQQFSDLGPSADVKAYIRAYLENHLTLLETVPEYPRMMAWENLEGGRTLARLPLQVTYKSFLDRVQQIANPLIEKGLLAKDFDLSHVAQAVMALSHFFVVNRGTLQHLFQTDPLNLQTREAWLDFCAGMLLSAFKQATLPNSK
jgi:AcrR family transcriptional regulator